MSFLKILLLGKNLENKQLHDSAIQKRIKNIKAIWNNEQHNDIGIEKIIRLILAFSQFFFLGTYIKQIYGKKGILYQDLSVDVLVLFKVFFPLIIIYFDLQHLHVGSVRPFEILIYWLMLETLMYVPTLIFAADIFSKPRSYRRSMLLLFFNYIEIVLDFAVLYSMSNGFNKPFASKIDSVYFSFVTTASIGYGDYYPIATFPKTLVIFQSVIFLLFIVIFISFFTTKIEHKGYFDSKNES